MVTSGQPSEPRTTGGAQPGARFGPVARILAGCAVLFLVLQLGATWLMGTFDPTVSALIASAAMLGAALLVEKLLFGRGPSAALAALGFGRPAPRALLVAAVVALIMLAVFLLFTRLAGVQVSLSGDWLWILLGAVALNGIAEEALFRGFVFGGLRRAGLTFRRSAAISMALFALVHLLLFLQAPFIVALLGTLVAVAAAFPMAYLFERGYNTLWAPALLHVAAHTVRWLDIPEPNYMTAVSVWLVLQLAVPFLVFAFRGYLGRVAR